MSSRKVVLYISMSLDGYIARENDDLSWLSMVATEGEDYGYSKMQERCDTYIVGRRTYETVLSLTGGSFPQSEMFKCYVLTRQERKSEKNIEFYSGDVKQLIESLKKKDGKDIYCDGGSLVVQELMKKELIDEYIISVIPILLGNGIRLFRGDTPEMYIKFISAKSYPSGLVQLKYEKK